MVKWPVLLREKDLGFANFSFCQDDWETLFEFNHNKMILNEVQVRSVTFENDRYLFIQKLSVEFGSDSKVRKLDTAYCSMVPYNLTWKHTLHIESNLDTVNRL